MDRRAFLAGSVTLAATALAGCGAAGRSASGPGSNGDYDVGMSNVDFLPTELTVDPGTTVVWKNTSSSQHTVTAYGAAIPDEADYFTSGGYPSQEVAEDAWIDGEGGIVQGDTYEHTFEVPGTYEYYCIPHETAGMRGTVVVSDES
jgi:plastocyanin